MLKQIWDDYQCHRSPLIQFWMSSIFPTLFFPPLLSSCRSFSHKMFRILSLLFRLQSTLKFMCAYHSGLFIHSVGSVLSFSLFGLTRDLENGHLHTKYISSMCFHSPQPPHDYINISWGIQFKRMSKGIAFMYCICLRVFVCLFICLCEDVRIFWI